MPEALRSYARQYFNSLKIMATRESKIFLAQYNEELKKILNKSLKKMPHTFKIMLTNMGKILITKTNKRTTIKHKLIIYQNP
jgi:hypothetical protein